MASGMDAKDAQMENMQQEHSSVQTQLLLCQDSVSQLQSELMQVTLACVFMFLLYRTGTKSSRIIISLVPLRHEI